MRDSVENSTLYGVRKYRLANGVLLLMFWLVMLFPLFPSVMQGSHIHINLLLLFFALSTFSVFQGRALPSSYMVVLLYFLLLQISIVLGVLLSDEGFFAKEFLSLLRPIQHSIIFLAVIVLYSESNLNDVDLINAITYFVLFSFAYLFVELFFVDYCSSVVYGLYKREYRDTLRLTYTSFFGTTYYSGFVFFSLYCLVLPFVFFYRRLRYSVVAVLLLIMIVAAQSKLMLIAVFGYTIIFLFWMMQGVLRLIIISFIAGLIFLLVSTDVLESFLDGISLTSASSLKRLLFDPQSSGTLRLRIEQIVFAFNEASILGVGSGQNLALESWLSSYVYRYGVMGALAFVVFNLYMGMKSYGLSRNCKSGGGFKMVFYRSLSLWFLFIPLTQLSSVMIDGSKFLYVYLLMISLVLVPDTLKVRTYGK